MMATVHVKVTSTDDLDTDSTGSESDGANEAGDESTHSTNEANGTGGQGTNNTDVELDGANEAAEMTNDSGLADVISKILTKPVPKHKSAILASGQTDRQIQKRKRAKERESGNVGKKPKQEKKESKPGDDSSDWSDASDEESNQDRRQALLRQKEWEEMGRVKPSLLDKDRERTFQKIATRGVVQLFNAVKQQQSMMGDKLPKPGLDKRKKTLQKARKNFLDILDSKAKKDKPQREDDESDKSGKWSILRDDFMMRARMKDWDKDSDDGDGGGGEDDSMAPNNDLSDSD